MLDRKISLLITSNNFPFYYEVEFLSLLLFFLGFCLFVFLGGVAIDFLFYSQVYYIWNLVFSPQLLTYDSGGS